MSENVGPSADPKALALPKHLYVHVPLCRSKCRYCDFYSLADDGSVAPDDLLVRTMLSAVAWTRRSLPPTPLETLYVGGGTPTMLGKHLPLLVSELGRLFGLAAGAEVTVEANPDSLDAGLLQHLADAGVTRVSLGVQSLSEDALHWLGRPHDPRGAILAMLAVADAGLDLSVDLMCGIPSVSPSLWRASLEAVVECGATHVSVYPLSVEPGTPLASAVEAGELVPDADSAAEEMATAGEVLEALGLRRYETANYAVPGRESRHNLAYWTGAPYLAIGPSAHGMLTAPVATALGLGEFPAEVARVRYAVPAELFSGSDRIWDAELETLTTDEALREDAMLGMRLAVGIADDLATRAGVTGPLEGLERDGLVAHSEGRWRTTERGWLLGNEVFSRIWLV